MTFLSWLIYLADIADSLNIVSVLLMCLFILVTGALSILKAVALSDDHAPEVLRNIPIRSYCFLTVFLTLLVVLTPSYKTVVSIAATEAAYTVVKTPEAQDMLTAVTNRLKKELGDDNATKE